MSKAVLISIRPKWCEKIADVGIMLDQMAIEFEVEDAVAEQRAFKIQRLRERMESDG